MKTQPLQFKIGDRVTTKFGEPGKIIEKPYDETYDWTVLVLGEYREQYRDEELKSRE